MGQRANGILYGCVAPDLGRASDYEEERIYGVVDRWEKVAKVPHHDNDKQRVRIEHEGGITLLGVWIAVGGSGEDGVPDFLEKAVRVDQLERVFHKQIRSADKLWERFRKHCQNKEKIILYVPYLWLTPCEVA